MHRSFIITIVVFCLLWNVNVLLDALRYPCIVKPVMSFEAIMIHWGDRIVPFACGLMSIGTISHSLSSRTIGR